MILLTDFFDKISGYKLFFVGLHWLLLLILICWLIVVAMIPVIKLRLVTIILLLGFVATYIILLGLGLNKETFIYVLFRFIEFRSLA